MKVKLNLTIGENTVKELKKEAKDLEISVSSFVTMLFKQYQKEKVAAELIQNQDLQKTLEKLMERKDKE